MWLIVLWIWLYVLLQMAGLLLLKLWVVVTRLPVLGRLLTALQWGTLLLLKLTVLSTLRVTATWMC